MNVPDLANGLQMKLKRRKYFVRLEILEHTLSLIKARPFISVDLFVQVYRNDRFQTTNLALIHNQYFTICSFGLANPKGFLQIWQSAKAFRDLLILKRSEEQ